MMCEVFLAEEGGFLAGGEGCIPSIPNGKAAPAGRNNVDLVGMCCVDMVGICGSGWKART